MQRADQGLIDHDNLEEFEDPLTYDLENGGDPGEDLYLAQALRRGGPVLDPGPDNAWLAHAPALGGARS